jgi:2-C-methyl-D-erythritol 2,4-cyclodiphosphate synthase
MILSGIGYDIHVFKEGRELWVGGVRIPSEIGLLGHSDADVLLHAIADALLGAAGLGDIGIHFPDTSPEWEDIKSIVLLEKVKEMLSEHGYRINNIDATLIMETPKISPYTNKMKEVIAACLRLSTDRVNIKATTNESLDAIGRKEGAAAIAMATIETGDS